jgi:hypothetical protein
MERDSGSVKLNGPHEVVGVPVCDDVGDEGVGGSLGDEIGDEVVGDLVGDDVAMATRWF